MRRGIRVGGLLVVAVFFAGSAHALATVRFALDDPSLPLGGSTTLEIRADLDVAVLGFGIDLLLDPDVLVATGAPTIGASWTPAFAPDGDGLIGLAPIEGVMGSDVLLASLVVMRTALAGTTIDGAITPGDLTEGFPLLTSGFDAVVFEPTLVAAIPEPGTAALLASGLAVLGSRRARRRPR